MGTKPDNVRCGTCVFFDDAHVGGVVCKRKQPRHDAAKITGDSDSGKWWTSYYPTTMAEDWCGEWSDVWPFDGKWSMIGGEVDPDYAHPKEVRQGKWFGRIAMLRYPEVRALVEAARSAKSRIEKFIEGGIFACERDALVTLGLERDGLLHALQPFGEEPRRGED